MYSLCYRVAKQPELMARTTGLSSPDAINISNNINKVSSQMLIYSTSHKPPCWHCSRLFWTIRAEKNTSHVKLFDYALPGAAK